MADDNLTWLTQWYLSQCDGDWEHSYGVKIDTLDNPGWLLKIELIDTFLEDRQFERVTSGEVGGDLEEWQPDGSWWVVTKEDRVFQAACGPLDLPTVIGIFRKWAE